MIEYVEGNILDAKVDALVNPVNCVGVMGAGLALAFKERYNDATEFFMNYYTYACQTGFLKPGQSLLFFTNELPARFVIHFPTKVHFKDKSELWYIEEGLKNLSSIVESIKIESIAFPRLGCGLGGLDWANVNPLLIKFSESHPNLKVLVYT